VNNFNATSELMKKSQIENENEKEFVNKISEYIDKADQERKESQNKFTIFTQATLQKQKSKNKNNIKYQFHCQFNHKQMTNHLRHSH